MQAWALFSFLFFNPCCAACGTLAPNQGLNPGPLQGKHGVLLTPLPESHWTTRGFQRALFSNRPAFECLRVMDIVLNSDTQKMRIIVPISLIFCGDSLIQYIKGTQNSVWVVASPVIHLLLTRLKPQQDQNQNSSLLITSSKKFFFGLNESAQQPNFTFQCPMWIFRM